MVEEAGRSVDTTSFLQSSIPFRFISGLIVIIEMFSRYDSNEYSRNIALGYFNRICSTYVCTLNVTHAVFRFEYIPFNVKLFYEKLSLGIGLDSKQCYNQTVYNPQY